MNRAICPVCERRVALRQDGMLRRHGAPWNSPAGRWSRQWSRPAAETCTGSGRIPPPEPTEAAVELVTWMNGDVPLGLRPPKPPPPPPPPRRWGLWILENVGRAREDAPFWRMRLEARWHEEKYVITAGWAAAVALSMHAGWQMGAWW